MSKEKKDTIISKIKGIKIPIALHLYSSIILVLILFSVILCFYMYNTIANEYVDNQCAIRLTTQQDALDTLIQEKSSTLLTMDDLISLIRSTELPSDVHIIFFNSKKEILFPTSEYDLYNAKNAKLILESLSIEKSNQDKIKELPLNDTVYYYTISPTPIIYQDLDGNMYTTMYLFYIDSEPYNAYYQAILRSMFKAIMIAIVASGFISIFVSAPILFTTRKLSKFASRISKSNFTPIKGRIISRELTDLADNMNYMANKLREEDAEQKTFFQNASHELRTPLMSIQGYAEGIKYDIFDEAEKENAIDVIIDETQRLSGMVENLLSISKMDMSRSGSYEVKKQLLNVEKINALIIDKVRGNFVHEDKEIINSLNVHNVYIYANENDIIRMLENIFSNCLRYARSRVCYKLFIENKYVVFSISDDGPGISPEVLEHLFERFAKGSDGKHGIGLALAKSIAEEHNGNIIAYNMADGGACFEMKIPITKPKEQLTHANNESVNKDGQN